MAEEPSPARDKTVTHSFNTAFGTEIIRIVVGPEQKVYRMHRSKLCFKIPIFITKIEETKKPRESDKGASNGKATQADGETVINFPEGNIASRDILLKWVYHSTLPALTVDRKSASGWSWDPFIFYILTDSLSLHSLSDTVMSLL
ncbi:hypothetical protein BDZ45DRAFT_755093 [Acephala macrosclerotiorum]|nr:hypothetical protein BDZ45DRAFT_755093 [Acephala macrosclerotiorum]